ncbi:hypothetical protein GCM10009539_75050 [Cryptosporangium japonicum]|uniref:Uncharacterized protein n=1 Tax=Cryptosporangium japonicum TaxID=80872 RepID=A0ABP3EVF6_9ACTN
MPEWSTAHSTAAAVPSAKITEAIAITVGTRLSIPAVYTADTAAIAAINVPAQRFEHLLPTSTEYLPTRKLLSSIRPGARWSRSVTGVG